MGIIISVSLWVIVVNAAFLSKQSLLNVESRHTDTSNKTYLLLVEI